MKRSNAHQERHRIGDKERKQGLPVKKEKEGMARSPFSGWRKE